MATDGVSEETLDQALARSLEVLLEVEGVAMAALQEASRRASAAEVASLVLEDPSAEAVREGLRVLA